MKLYPTFEKYNFINTLYGYYPDYRTVFNLVKFALNAIEVYS